VNVASTTTSAASPHGDALLALYDTAMPEVYGYLHRRCRNRVVAEDLTTEVFLAAVDSIDRNVVTEVTIAWLIGIARHKIVDHWRRMEREQRKLHAVADDAVTTEADPWDARLDVMAARDVLANLGAHHRSALTLRYVDDLPVASVARILDRTVHATEALLARARRAFRAGYEALQIDTEPS
jgi:RNA polymerase sigma-70 factor (ECF subfamily)